MNLWAELLFVLVRAVLISLGTLMAHHGWISETTATHVSGPAAAWLSAGLFVIAAAVGQSAWSKIRTAAAARLALMFPAGTPAACVIAAMREVTRSALWSLASGVTDAERKQLRDAADAVRRVLVRHGYEPPAESDAQSKQ
ncbi:MAG: hypothetical protein JWO56_703 [Acidobacteria bacterium]|nr:hypothetical protein [Acidobacteriota bacterium]